MIIEPEFSGVSIVLVGSLNPRIFTPDWFVRHQILSPQEADAAEVEIVHQQITKFRTDWFDLQVQTNKFESSTTQGPPVPLLDFVVRTFREFLSHTPIGRLGINRDMHFNVESPEVRDRIGYSLAPPDAWGDWAPMITSGEGERHGGMVSLVMQQRELDDRPKGYIQATVQPSLKIKGRTGIYVQINDHYEIEDPDKVSGCEEIIDLLERNFDESIKRSNWIIDQVMRMKDA